MTSAVTYYLDNTNGDDGWSGTYPEPRGIPPVDGPWRTLAKVGPASAGFAPGDEILLKRGEMWRETLSPAFMTGGAEGNRVVFGAYGTGVTPLVNGAEAAKSWTRYAPNVWWTAVFTENPGHVHFDHAEGIRVTQLAEITEEREWYYDYAARVLFVYAPDDVDPAETYRNPGVEGCVRTGIVIRKSHVTVRDIDCVLTATTGILWRDDEASLTDLLVENCDLAHGNGNAVEIRESNAVIQNCRIHDYWNGLIYGAGADGAGFSLWAGSDHAVIRNNIIQDCAAGIGTAWNKDVLIYNNVFSGIMVNGINHSCGDAAHPIRIFNNTMIFRPKWDAGHGVCSRKKGNGFVVKNNVFYCTYPGPSRGCQCIYFDKTSCSGIDIDYNIYYIAPGSIGKVGGFDDRGDGQHESYSTLEEWQAALATWAPAYGNRDAHSLSRDPAFTDFDNGDFSLRETSPGVNVGTFLPEVATDIDGIVRPQDYRYDLGAFELPGEATGHPVHSLAGTVVFKYPGWTQTTVPVMYQVRNPGLPPTAPVYSGTLTITVIPGNPASGAFTLDGIVDDTYDVTLKHANHVADRKANLVIAGADVTGLIFSLWAGDADSDNNCGTVYPADPAGDNDVDFNDYRTFSYQYTGKRPVTAGYNADFNGDGTTDLMDYRGLGYGYTKQGNPGNWWK